jgi:hypothetical protein
MYATNIEFYPYIQQEHRFNKLLRDVVPCTDIYVSLAMRDLAHDYTTRPCSNTPTTHTYTAMYVSSRDLIKIGTTPWRIL